MTARRDEARRAADRLTPDVGDLEPRLIEMVRQLRSGSLKALADFLDANESGQGGTLMIQGVLSRAKHREAVEIGYASENWKDIVQTSIDMRTMLPGGDQ